MDPLFLKYANRFAEHGFSLYMIGGTSRDYLLQRPYHDWDFVTDATPEEMRLFLIEADFHFAKFGSVHLKDDKKEIDITTLREEGEYLDHRHPSYIHFVKELEKDAKRRDFTINAIYIDKEGHTYDFYHGLEDLDHHLIRFIGDPFERVQEDPLRILRAERFAKKLGFSLEEKTKIAIENSTNLLSNLNPEKIRMEEKKAEE